MPWRDVRGDRQVLARFIDRPLAGMDRTLASAPTGNSQQLLTAEAEPVGGDQDDLLYELVSWGDTVTRYRVRS